MQGFPKPDTDVAYNGGVAHVMQVDEYDKRKPVLIKTADGIVLWVHQSVVEELEVKAQ